MTTPYVTGTVSVTAGSAVVTGNGTGWDTSGLVAGVLGVDGLSVPVLSIDSDTSLTLAKPWPGPTASGKDYWITYDTEDGQQTVGLTQLVAEYVARLAKPFFASLSGLTPAPNTLPYFGPGAVGALANLTPKAIDLLAGADAASMRKVLGAPVGQLRNKIINPLFSVNQRGVSGTVTLAAGEYGHDRFKAGPAGCTYSFSVNNGVTSLNIASGSLQQVIEASVFAGEPGVYFLSWVGSAQARFAGGTYGSSGAVSASINGAANVGIEFGTGTVSLVQLEKEYVTPFSARHFQQETMLCQHYFWRGYSGVSQNQFTTAAGQYASWFVPYPAPMRAIPTLSRTEITGGAWSNFLWDSPTLYAARLVAGPSVGANTAGGVTITGYLQANAEL